MPALVRTKTIGTTTWLGRVPDRERTLRSIAQSSVEATFAGVEGEAHAGLTRRSCSRVTSQFPLGTEIRNVRQFSIVSAEELAAIANEMGLDAVQPEWLGASMVVDGIPDFSHVPPGSRLQTGSGTTLTVDMQNRPCRLPARFIDEDAPGFGELFKAAAKERRGVTAWVEREGPIRVGDLVTLHIPDQREWRPE